jgi:hypothetical protein
VEVAIRYHSRVRPALERLRDSLGTDIEERAGRYEQLLNAIRERLIQHNGMPPEAFAEVKASHMTYWFQFCDELLVQYILRDVPPLPRGWWDIGRRLTRWRRGVVRTVIIIELIRMPAAPDGEPLRG